MATCVMPGADTSEVRVKTDDAFGIVLAALFLLVYTQGYLVRVGVPPNVVKMMIELPIFIIMLLLVNRGMQPAAPGGVLIALYVVWTVASTIFSGDGLPLAFLYCRYVVYAYIVFAAVWAMPLTRTAVARINATLILLFLFQIAASAHEVLVQGERVEAHVGALFADGGALATEFPLLAMGLTMPFYFYWRGNPLLLVLSWAFFLVGYASGKRAIYFLGPFLYFCIVGWHVWRARTPQARTRSIWAVAIFVGLVPLLLWGVSRSHGISDYHPKKRWEQVTYALRAMADYTTAEGRAGQTTGRTSTSRRVFSTLVSEKAETILFGHGPSAMREDAKRYQALMIGYGICGWAQDVICIGWPGMVLYLLFHLLVFHRLRSCALPGDSGYWMAIRFGAEIGFLVLLLSYITYSSSFTTGGQLSYVYFYLLALLMSPQHRHVVQGEG